MTSIGKQKMRQGGPTAATALHRRGSAAVTAIAFAASVLASGCASAPPPPGLDLNQARIVTTATAPRVDIGGLPGKAAGAGVGAGAGTGYGALAGGLACVATGPFIGLCLALVLPTTMGVGAVTGAAVGAARTESAVAMGVKAKALGEELVAQPYHELLARQLQEQMRIETHELPFAVAASGVPAAIDVDALRPWTVEVGVSEIGTEGSSEFALRLVATMRVRRAGTAVAWDVTREVQSETELAITQWMANDAAALRGVSERCIRKAAQQLGAELLRSTPDPTGKARPASRKSASCDDVATQWLRAAAQV